jgi:metal-responsive CopG/Arc/MetJ family transcriptional regulator
LAKQPRSKISVLLTEEELARFERYCVERGYKKSTLIARLIRDYLDAEQARAQAERPLNRPER